MPGTWKTQKGDEWEYCTASVTASADHFSSEGLFVIRDIHNPKGRLDEHAVLSLLTAASALFPGDGILIKLRPGRQNIEAALQLLQEGGLLDYSTVPAKASSFQSIRSTIPESYRLIEISGFGQRP